MDRRGSERVAVAVVQERQGGGLGSVSEGDGERLVGLKVMERGWWD